MTTPTYVHVLDSFKAETPEQLNLKKGMYIRILKVSDDDEDYYGEIGIGPKNIGWFPVYYVETVDEAALPSKAKAIFKRIDKHKEKMSKSKSKEADGDEDDAGELRVPSLAGLSPRKNTDTPPAPKEHVRRASLSPRRTKTLTSPRKSSRKTSGASLGKKSGSSLKKSGRRGDRSPRGNKVALPDIQITHSINSDGASEILERSKNLGDAKFKKSHMDPEEYLKLYNGPTFGVPLAHLMYIGYNEYVIPPILEKCIEYLLKHSDVEGIFRVSGDQDKINSWKEQFNNGEPVEFAKESNPHNVSGLLKAWLRELPEPLLTYEMTDKWLNFNQLEDASPEKLATALEMLKELPVLNREVLCELFAFLYMLMKSAKINLMTSDNIGIVIGPNILQTKSMDPFENAKIMPVASKIASYFVLNYPKLFPVIQAEISSPRPQQPTK